jgi:hypothetical protein
MAHPKDAMVSATPVDTRSDSVSSTSLARGDTVTSTENGSQISV